MVEFKVVRHVSRRTEVCEVWIDGEMKAAIYPDDDATGIRIMSSHVDGAPDGVGCWEFKFTEGLASEFKLRS